MSSIYLPNELVDKILKFSYEECFDIITRDVLLPISASEASASHISNLFRVSRHARSFLLPRLSVNGGMLLSRHEEMLGDIVDLIKTSREVTRISSWSAVNKIAFAKHFFYWLEKLVLQVPYDWDRLFEAIRVDDDIVDSVLLGMDYRYPSSS